MLLTAPQLLRLQRYSVRACVDIHCHVLPGVDDGPATIDVALALCRALCEDGITAVMATPHQLGRYDRRNAGPAVREAVSALRGRLEAEGVPLDVYAGADVRVDERILTLVGSGDVLTLADSGFMLLELPHDTYIDPLPLVRLLGSRGVRSVITHPERQEYVRTHAEVIGPWLQAGALLQVTAGSLAGAFGGRAKQSAWDWVNQGRIAFVATDAHDTTRRPPCMTRAIELLEERAGAEVARRLCIDNPLRVLEAGLRRGATTAPAQRPAPATVTGGGSGTVHRPRWGARRE